MSIPCSIVGYGMSTAQNVFKIKFHYPLSAKPTWEAYDGSAAAFPAVGDASSTTNKIFTGSTAFPTGMLALVDTTGGTYPGATTWFPLGATAGTTGSVNIMVGQTSYVQAGTIPDTGATNLGSITFNQCVQIPHDVYPTMTTRHDLVSRYSYSGSMPNPSFFVNDAGTGGTDATPSWQLITSGTHGIRHTRSGITGSPYLANIPDPATASLEKTAMGWATT